MTARVQQNWRQVIRTGIPELVVTRRALAYGDRVLEVGAIVNATVPEHRLRPLFEARRIGLGPVEAIQPVTPEKEIKKHGFSKKQARQSGAEL